MSLRGLPDLHKPVLAHGLEVYYPYEGGEYIVVPDRLEVAERHNGDPDFSLEWVRGQDPSLPPEPYGVLDFKVRPHYRMTEALTVVREQHPRAMLRHAFFVSGFLRLYAHAGADEIPDDLLEAIPLAWNGLDTARLTVRLSSDTAMLLKSALQDRVMTIGARSEMEMLGVSARLPVRIRFNPAELLEALAALSDEDLRIARDDMVEFFRDDPSSLPLEVSGEIHTLDPEAFAQTVVDWIRIRFGSFVASPEGAQGLYLSLVSPVEIGDGSFEWDLSEPLRAVRPVVLSLEPLESAYRIVQSKGLEAVFRETTVPPIPTGIHKIEIDTNLPSNPQDILALGVTIRAAPRPPHRFQAIVKTVEITPPEETASVLLRLSPVEQLEYTFVTFVVLRTPLGIIRLDGEEQIHRGSTLKLHTNSFPVEFVPIEASRALLALAEIRGTFSWSDNDDSMARNFELREGQPAVTLTIPRGGTNRTFEIEARSREGLGTLHLGPVMSSALSLDLHSFPEYGPQTIQIKCVFDDQTEFVAIDLLSEEPSEASGEVTVLHFTPDKPIREWSWFASSPFKGGYRYRYHSPPDRAPLGWSKPQAPYSDLRIDLGQQLGEKT